MDRVHRSLWLPVGPANFFSIMTDPELVEPTGTTRRSSRSGPAPHLRESIFRRLVEVLPVSFGYDPSGRCEPSTLPDDKNRPGSLTMTLRPADVMVGWPSAREANRCLIDNGIEQVTLRVDEHGFYAFTAAGETLGDGAGDALQEHIVQVFGDGFEVNRLTPPTDRHRFQGRDAVREYNGLPVDIPAAGQLEQPDGPPRGALSFYQLNLMMEGLCNQSLLPSVFFEHYDQARTWLAGHRRTTSVITRLDDYIREITIDADGSQPAGQMVVLQRFLLVSRGSLQWMRRSVESVRRSLLDQMMAVSHRQSRLIQLDLAGMDYERTPELTGDATESQLRGYVMLIATKLPLIAGVSDTALAAAAAVQRRINDDDAAVDADTLLAERLVAAVESWTDLLNRLQSNVVSLETAVEHDWQERLLYEQEQARSEQEAMAEIERTRRGRPESRRSDQAAYNAIMLIVTVISVVIAVRTGSGAGAAPGGSSTDWWRVTLSYWPLIVLAALLLISVPVVNAIRRFNSQRGPHSEVYSFEFAFRLDEAVNQKALRDYLTARAVTVDGPIKIRRLGGWRWERISTDTTVLKVHSIAVVRVSRRRYARFEIVTEVMMRKISNNEQLFLRQCRMFGDSPVALSTDQITVMVKKLLGHACHTIAPALKLETLTHPIEALTSRPST
jgi:hypothetical protein